jgi:DNA-binding beta-propeller fold protein YncE
MKTNALSLLMAGAMLLLPLTQEGCAQSRSELSFTHDENQYVRDPQNGGVSIFSRDGSLLETYRSTAAGSEQAETPLPSSIIKYLLPGKGYQGKIALVHTLLYPTRLAWGVNGNLYVSDNANNSVFIYDGGLNVLGELKGLAQPLGVIVDGDGNIYVGNQGRKNVEVYDALGNLLRSIGDGDIGKPNDLALDRDNNIYILDSGKGAVLVYDQGGTLLSVIGDALLIKYGVAIAINYRDDGIGTEIGELYIADQRSCAIHVFALDGTYRKSIGGRGSLYTSNWDGLFAGLMAVAIDPYGNIHGLDNNLNVVQVFEPQNGTFLGSYNAYLPENAYRLNLQTDIAIHPADHRVVLSNVATSSIETIATVPAP